MINVNIESPSFAFEEITLGIVIYNAQRYKARKKNSKDNLSIELTDYNQRRLRKIVLRVIEMLTVVFDARLLREKMT